MCFIPHNLNQLPPPTPNLDRYSEGDGHPSEQDSPQAFYTLSGPTPPQNNRPNKWKLQDTSSPKANTPLLRSWSQIVPLTYKNAPSEKANSSRPKITAPHTLTDHRLLLLIKKSTKIQQQITSVLLSHSKSQWVLLKTYSNTVIFKLHHW